MAIQVVDAAFVTEKKSTMGLLDVRTPEEYREGHIPGALNDPVGRMGPTQAFMERAQELFPHTAEPLIVYCRKGTRSARAAELLSQAGYEQIYDYAGSWLDWSSDPQRPIER